MTRDVITMCVIVALLYTVIAAGLEYQAERKKVKVDPKSLESELSELKAARAYEIHKVTVFAFESGRRSERRKAYATSKCTCACGKHKKP